DGDEPAPEEAGVVERLVVMTHLLHRPRVVGVAGVARRDPGLVVGGREVTHAGRRGGHAPTLAEGRHWTNVNSATMRRRARAPAGSRPRAAASPSRSRRDAAA